MPSEKETPVLKSKDYKIDGNSLRAFYDARGKLVFVLDLTVDEIKPNVLLVMASHGDRKWDDVLANDYAMDLELVRPKKDNKYQKLDVEYDGLDVYSDLIDAYKNDGDVRAALRALADFRAASGRRSATERLEVATAIAENARETIERAGDTIIELQAKIKALRSKLTVLRRSVGREPTKQSAAKILKAEAQLDVLNTKLARAKKRLENANKRLLVAEDDMAAAQRVLDLIPGSKNSKKINVAPVVAPVKRKDVAPEPDDDEVEQPDDEPDDSDADKVESDDADDEVKPLFDRDPNIMDENIAFRPINFDETPVKSVADDASDENVTETFDYDYSDDESGDAVVAAADDETVEKTDDDAHDAPAISFEPPRDVMNAVSVPDGFGADDDDVRFDDVYSESENTDVDYDADATSSESVLGALKSVDDASKKDLSVDAPVEMDENINVTSVVSEAPVAPAPGIAETVARPSSPVQRPVVQDVPRVAQSSHKPNLLYYVLLLVLIALSVFTLWLYQRSNVSVDAVPELVVSQTPSDASTDIVTDESDDNPFVASGAQVVESQPILQQVATDTLNNVAKVADVQPIAEPEPVEPEPEVAEPVVEAEYVEPTEVQEMVDVPVVVDKPVYDVNTDKPVTMDSAIVGGDLCDGDVAPDANGCCPGETYSASQNACCPNDGGDCLTPMF